MNLYNIDMHISVIHDIKTIFNKLGHTIESICMSGHTWVNNEEPKTTEVINNSNWKNINQEMCDNFYNKYKDKLKHIDAFIHSYPPAFALLFEKFNKPIITIACTRFEYPCEDKNWLISGLSRLKKNNQIIPITNNLFDKKHCEVYTNFEWKHISSLCDYMKVRYKPTNNFIIWSKSIYFNNKLIEKFNIENKYNRNDNVKYKGIIHIPYNISIMSAFEQYYCNIPLFVPTVECLNNWRDKNVLSELYFNNNSDFKWIELSDWYDDDNMPYTVKYKNEEDLYNKLDCDCEEISGKMYEFNKIRKNKIYNQWESVLNGIK